MAVVQFSVCTAQGLPGQFAEPGGRNINNIGTGFDAGAPGGTTNPAGVGVGLGIDPFANGIQRAAEVGRTATTGQSFIGPAAGNFTTPAFGTANGFGLSGFGPGGLGPGGLGPGGFGFGGFGPGGFGGGGLGNNPRGGSARPLRTRLRAAIDPPVASPAGNRRVAGRYLNAAVVNRIQSPTIAVRQGVAAVSGTAADARGRRMAELMLRLEPGIDRVDNRIRVGANR